MASYSPATKDRQKWKQTEDMSAFTTHVGLDSGIQTVEKIVQDQD